MKEDHWPGFLKFRKIERIRNWVLIGFIILSFVYTWYGLGVWKNHNRNLGKDLEKVNIRSQLMDLQQDQQLRDILKRLISIEEQVLQLQTVGVEQILRSDNLDLNLRAMDVRLKGIEDVLRELIKKGRLK